MHLVAALPQRLAQPARGVARLREAASCSIETPLACAAPAVTSATTSAIIVRAVLSADLEANLGLSLVDCRFSSTMRFSINCGIDRQHAMFSYNDHIARGPPSARGS